MSVSFTRKSFWPPDGCQKNCIIAKRNARVRSTIPIRENLVWRDRTPNDRPFTPQENQCLILHFLVSLGAQEQPDIALIFHINVEINWQLSKQGIRWPVSPDRMAGSGIEPSRSSIVLKLSADRLLLFKWSQAKVHFFFNSYEICSFMCRTVKILISNWPCKRKFSQLLQGGKTVAFDFVPMVTRWSRSTSNFYALIGQNLTGDFMRKIYASSWNLLTLTAEVDRVLCQLVMFLTVFFRWMYKMK